MFLNKNLVYLKSVHELNQKESSEDIAAPIFIPSKCALTTGLSKSPSQTTKRCLSGDNEGRSDEEMRSDDDNDDHNNDDEDIFWYS